MQVTNFRFVFDVFYHFCYRYFNFGEGECPFSVSCFYRHAYKDGTLQDRTKIDPRQTRRHQWDNSAFADLLSELVGDEGKGFLLNCESGWYSHP